MTIDPYRAGYAQGAVDTAQSALDAINECVARVREIDPQAAVVLLAFGEGIVHRTRRAYPDVTPTPTKGPE